ncbi:MAG TPA: GNAT family N-acetyltransferase [Candidatus Polarisedimenticolaceae bacterium]
MTDGAIVAIPPEDHGAWWDAISDLPDAHPFYHPDVLSHLARQDDSRAELLTYREGTKSALLPWLVRDLPPRVVDRVGGRFRHDAVGPDYGGPVGSFDADVLGRFYDALGRFAADRGILTAFLRLNPFGGVQALLEHCPNIQSDRDIVWLDLTRGFDALWAEFAHSARKNYKRALASGLEFTASTSDEAVEGLAGVYAATMTRRHAEDRYRLDLEFFRGLTRLAGTSTLIVTARLSGRPVASHLYLCDSRYAFSYLGGALSEFAACRPTNGVVTEAIKLLSGRGATRLVLGGGYHAGDGIERFKRTFSRSTIGFRTQRLVFDESAYQAATTEQREDARTSVTDFFPAYRATDS